MQKKALDKLTVTGAERIGQESTGIDLHATSGGGAPPPLGQALESGALARGRLVRAYWGGQYCRSCVLAILALTSPALRPLGGVERWPGEA